MLALTAKQRLKLLERVFKEGVSVSSACQEFAVSRFTFYKWKKRWKEGGRRIEALRDRKQEYDRVHLRVKPEHERAILSLVIEYPDLSKYALAEKLARKIGPVVGVHGVYNVLLRNGLNTPENRLAYARIHTPEVSIPLRWIDKVRYVLEQFVPSVAPADPPVISTIWRLLTIFVVSLILVAGTSYSLAWWINLVSSQVGASAIGIIFASIAFFAGSLFFLYSLKYYLTLAIVLSFSQQEVNSKSSIVNRNGKKRGLLSWLLGLNGDRGPASAELRRGNAVGLTPNLEHITLKRYPVISIHIPFYNENNVVERSIAAATNFDYPEYEVVLCDDSTDETTQIIRDYLKKSIKGGKGTKGTKGIKGEGWTLTSAEVRPGVTLKHLHRTSRSGFKGGALRLALRVTDRRAEFISVFDADFVPYPDTLELFLKYFKAVGGWKEEWRSYGKVSKVGKAPKVSKAFDTSNVAAVQGYQWHVLNKSENWITRGIRSEYAGSYVIERSGAEIYQGLKMISGAVYMIRRDVLEEVGWETSITEDFQLTLKLYEKGYKVIYTPYIQAPAECVSTLKHLIRQRMRWAEGHSNNIRRMFFRLLLGKWETVGDSGSENTLMKTNGKRMEANELMDDSHIRSDSLEAEGRISSHSRVERIWKPSPLTLSEKLEFLYLSPYYLQAFFFLIGTLSWLISETLFPARLPFWTQLWGWSLVLTNMLSLPLMNAVGLFLEESEEKDYSGLASFVALSYIMVPFQAYASLKGFLKGEGPWFRTPKTGKITDILKRGTFYRFISGILPGRVAPSMRMAANEKAGMYANKYFALSTANNRFDAFVISRKRIRWLGKTFLVILLIFSTTILGLAPGIPSLINPQEVGAQSYGNILRPNSSNSTVKGQMSPIQSQDFSWGVLAINTNKSIYLSSEARALAGLPPETAKLSLSVLDEEGKMVCDAKLELRITNYELRIEDVLSTEDGTIQVNPECQIHDFTTRPDFEAEYKVGEAGTYEMELTAETKNGTKTIKDSFEVRQEVPFDIERDTATRIYPAKSYPVEIKIKARQDFEGTVKETVPNNFSMVPVSKKGVLPISNIETQGQAKIVSWKLKLKTGQTSTLIYRYDAPDKSPDYYQLGFLSFVDNQQKTIFQESRHWQLAIDTTYYVDATTGNDADSGLTEELAWQTLDKVAATAYSAGDRILFKRGETWSGDNLWMSSSGVEGNPVTYSTYGTGDRPIIENNDPIFEINGDWIVVEGFFLQSAPSYAINIRSGKQHNIVRDCEITDTGQGVVVKGQYNLITLNYFHDLKMVVNTVEPTNDDYGANAVSIQAANNEVSYNRMITCRAASYDYTWDGGAVEIWQTGDNLNFHHNWVQDCDGVIEIGSDGSGTAENVIVAYNICIDNGIFSFVHLAGTFATAVTNLKLENNTIVENFHDHQHWQLIGWSGTPSSGTAYLRNNIIWVTADDMVYVADGGAFTHTYNIYHLTDCTLGFTLSTGESEADPLFMDIGNDDLHLKSNSPCINAGTNLGVDCDDAFDPRDSTFPYDTVDQDNFGSGWEIGAFVYAPSSTSSLATAYSFQRKTFYDSENDRYWSFFYDGTQIDIYYSSDDGTSWTEDTSLAYNTNDFSVWWETVSGTEYVWIAYVDGFDVKARRGELGTSAISWDASTYTPYDGDSSTNEYDYPTITRDSNGKIWITAVHHSSTNYLFKVIQSTNANDVSTWQTASTLDTSANSNKYGVIVPLNSGDVYAAWIDNATIEGCFYDEVTSDQWEDSSGTACSTSVDTIDTGVTGLANNLSAVADTTNYDVHLLYIEDDTTDTVSYARWDNGTGTNGTWQTEVTLDSSDNDAYVTLSIDSDTDDLYAIWMDTTSNDIFYRSCDDSAASSECSVVGDWASETDWKDTTSGAHLTSNYSGPTRIFSQWTEGSSSPYSVMWDYIIVPEYLWLFFGLGPVLPLLLKRRGKRYGSTRE